jgi:hypothetical protein
MGNRVAIGGVYSYKKTGLLKKKQKRHSDMAVD